MQPDLTKPINHNFSIAAKTYDDYCDIQKISAKNLARLIVNTLHFTPRNILDIGSGTGHLTHELRYFFPDATYSLMDISEEMLKISKTKFQQFPYHYMVGDGENLEFVMNVIRENEIDLIVSNLCFQWFEKPNIIFDALKRVKPIFVGSLGHGSFGEWYDSVKKIKQSYEIPINFMNITDESHIIKYEIPYCDGIDFLRTQKKIGTTSLRPLFNNVELRKIIKIFQEQYQSQISYYLVYQFCIKSP